ncbi:MAG: hypothetical protein H0T11_03060 [Chthoniobacterales bacterium]|nr:hypothetical protein [Chthoniobacterales bacterium]
MSYAGGIVMVTVGRSRQKLFEIYDRIALGAIGHPGDIERLRMSAIELASTEGFTRSAADVSLRRLAFYSLSPVLKAAFEQIYGAPYLARMLFAEIGGSVAEDLFLRVEYDGAIVANAGLHGVAQQHFGVVSATAASTELMESFLQEKHDPAATLPKALELACDAWTIGKLALGDDGIRELPDKSAIASERRKQIDTSAVEAAVLDRDAKLPIRYRSLGADDLKALKSS